MRGKVRGEPIERSLDQGVVGDIRRAFETSQPRCPLPVVLEQAVHVGSNYPAVG